jgi:hypothetical protein
MCQPISRWFYLLKEMAFAHKYHAMRQKVKWLDWHFSSTTSNKQDNVHVLC